MELSDLRDPRSIDAEPALRLGEPADADAIGQLLHDFNTEFGDPTPGPRRLAERLRGLLAEGQITVLLIGPTARSGEPRGPANRSRVRPDAGSGDASRPAGLAVLRFRPAIWTHALECYLAELYVVPHERGQGLGRSLMQGAIALARSRGAGHMDLGTSESDTVARALYESLGFSNREGGSDGPFNYFYEREL